MKENRKIHVILGTKAQLIKMAPLMAKMEKDGINYNFIFTGQHQKTIDQLRENFSIKNPDIILHEGKDITGIFQMLGWLTKLSFKTIFKRKKIFGETKKNDIILTHGDTFSTVLGAILGRLARIKVGHIESGLRSFDIFNPFPEELNRKATFRLSHYYYCPGNWAVENLKKYKREKINTISNTLLDSLKHIKSNFHKSTVEIPNEKFCICSIHRFENIFKRKKFKQIIDLVIKTSKKIKVLFILHPPTIQQLKKLNLYKALETAENIELRPRYDYLDFIKLLDHSEFIITDGGSNQEEATYLGKPCLLMREKTERQEGIGKNVVISKYNEKITNNFIDNYQNYKKDFTNIETSPSQIILNHIMN